MALVLGLKRLCGALLEPLQPFELSSVGRREAFIILISDGGQESRSCAHTCINESLGDASPIVAKKVRRASECVSAWVVANCMHGAHNAPMRCFKEDQIDAQSLARNPACFSF